MSSKQALHIRGEGTLEAAILSAGAATVRFRAGGKTREVPSWKVAHIAYDDTPAAWYEGEEHLAEGRFAKAIAAFEALGEAKHPAAAWGGYQAANARRVQAGVAERGHDEAAAAYRRYLKRWPDDLFAAPAQLGLGLTLLEAGEGEPAAAAFDALDQERFGPVWRLWAELGRARLEVRARRQAPALTRLRKVFERAKKTTFAREPRQMAQALRVDTLARLGSPEAAMRAVPQLEDARGARIAIDGAEWLSSPATPLLLNAIGRALVARAPGVVGGTGAAPFHLRVVRYHAGHHIEHARALRHLTDCFRAAKQTEYAAEFGGMLAELYPEAPTRSAKLPGHLGDGK